MFFVVNLALIAIKRRRGPAPSGFRVPTIVAGLGALASLSLMVFVHPRAFLTVMAMVVLGMSFMGMRWMGRSTSSTP